MAGDHKAGTVRKWYIVIDLASYMTVNTVELSDVYEFRLRSSDEATVDRIAILCWSKEWRWLSEGVIGVIYGKQLILISAIPHYSTIVSDIQGTQVTLSWEESTDTSGGTQHLSCVRQTSHTDSRYRPGDNTPGIWSAHLTLLEMYLERSQPITITTKAKDFVRRMEPRKLMSRETSSLIKERRE